jgi:hypothetical protein
MRPHFQTLKKHYPRREDVTRPDLFKSIGWQDLINDANYANTCAIRMSLALLRCGVNVPGRMRINDGPFKGKLIEPGQAKLSAILSRTAFLGAPERYDRSHAARSIGGRSGIVSFFRLTRDYTGGHIDIVSPSTGGIQTCGSDCYWTSREIWFWPIS